MKIFFVLCVTCVLLTACGSSKPRVITKKEDQPTVVRTKRDHIDDNKATFIEDHNAEDKATQITNYALKFKGTPYKFGGTTKRGMDCSGLIHKSFEHQDITLPRTSRAMSLKGERLRLKELTKGDLLFFQTNKNNKVINHVGLVVGVNDDDILFIHSTTSRGVIVSNFNEAYWRNAFVMARRVL